ncbi:uncharacterized protein [Branchiostoma lanceolatum]|uniref:uncharacterized protein isoform X1 n=1 Tax=Branchiostoma lanceolatum TaxID=7740 RepID=UPI003454E808
MTVGAVKKMFTLALIIVILLKLTSADPGHVGFKDTGTHIPTSLSTRGRSKVNRVSPSVIWSSHPPIATKNIEQDGRNKGETEDSAASKPPGTPAGIVPYKGMLLRTADCSDPDMETPVKVFDIFADMWQLIALAAMVCLAVSLIVTFVLCVLLFRMRVTKELERDLQDRQPMKPDLGDTTSYVSFNSPDDDMPDDLPIKIVIQDTEMEDREERNEPRPNMSTFKIRKMTPV